MPAIALFDSHCHLDFPHFDQDRDAVRQRMQQAGVNRAMLVSTELSHVPRIRALAESDAGFCFSVGVHPNHAPDTEPDAALLMQYADHPRCRAIGETGMDFFRHHVAPDVQRARFKLHIQVAQDLDLPLIIHMRDADEPCMHMLESMAKNGKIDGIMHCFSSTLTYAERALALGMDISFSGNVTYKRNDALRAVASSVPAERLLVETDAPFLAPVPHRGARNEPAFVRDVAVCLAKLRGVSLTELATQCTANAMQRFGLND
ncbi:MAG: TatD family hydrolase [Mariprofundaceae bacterium]|nr:TatD family hydrolase [Mariprofundaceae bacterium]